MKDQDARDWCTMFCITLFMVCVLRYLFVHPDVATFATVCGILPTLIGLYQFLCLRDAKTPDANNDRTPR